MFAAAATAAVSAAAAARARFSANAGIDFVVHRGEQRRKRGLRGNQIAVERAFLERRVVAGRLNHSYQ